MNFSDLKKRRSDFSDLAKKADDLSNNKGNNYEDKRVWKATIDKAGNGSALVRLLDAPKDEELPWARLFTHFFKGPGGVFAENCPTTIGKECPACKANSALWNSGVEANKEIARGRKRKLTYISNILVVQDKGNPENEGKVFLMKYGKKIFDKISAIMKPEEDGESAVYPFDFWSGANLRLKIKTVDKYLNYDDSKFTAPSPLFEGDDDEIEKLWKQEYPLAPFTDEKEFKSYEELEAKLAKVLGGRPPMASTAEELDEEAEEPKPRKTRKPKQAPVAKETEEDSDDAAPFDADPQGGNGDEQLDYFASLAEED